MTALTGWYGPTDGPPVADAWPTAGAWPQSWGAVDGLARPPAPLFNFRTKIFPPRFGVD
jgi:hypothetical protein